MVDGINYGQGSDRGRIALKGDRADQPPGAALQAVESSVFLLLKLISMGLPGPIKLENPLFKMSGKGKALLLFHAGDLSVNKTTPLPSSLILVEKAQTSQDLKGQYLQSCRNAIASGFSKQHF